MQQKISKLFADRWFKTLNERYPIFNLVSHLTSLDSILRESCNNGPFLSAIASTMAKLNFSLNRTRIKSDKKEPSYAQKNIAAMFGNISEVKEDYWIIVIDEIERAQFDEIYRVIEVIERFKNEASYNDGLPIRIVFLLCLSNSHLQQKINDFKTTNEKAFLINDFFFNDPKSRDRNLFLPPISYEIRKKFVYDSLDKILIRENLNEITKRFLEQFNSPIEHPMEMFFNQEQALNWILEVLYTESPRLIGKLCQELELFYYCFRGLDGNKYPDAIALCDVMVISYIKIKYPFLIEFLKKVVGQETKELDEYEDIIEFNNIKENKNIKIPYNHYLQDSVKSHGFKEEIDNFITNLIGLISYKNSNPLEEGKALDKREYSRTSFDKILMLSALKLVITGHRSNTPYQTYKAIDHKSALIKNSNEDLIEYASLLTRTISSTYDQHLDVANELLYRLEGAEDRKLILYSIKNCQQKVNIVMLLIASYLQFLMP
jgi:hypothetical protein